MVGFLVIIQCMILGIDEVGRGPWAGPLVVGAVVLGGARIDGLTDSKKLSKKRRQELDVIIREEANGFGIGWVSSSEIDELGLSESLRLATTRAVSQVKTTYHEIIIDGTVNFLSHTVRGEHVTTVKKADLLIPSVSAASIIAKVARDNFMAEQDLIYPGYGFGSHVGYGTSAHRQAIEQLGVTPLHRLSFEPLRKYRVASDDRASIDKGQFSPKTTKQVGDDAESTVVGELESKGHEVIARNWRTRFCEVDIVSVREDVIYFTEVKYRRSADYGDGYEAITSKKQRQMRFAAELFILKNPKFEKLNQRLLAASVSGYPVIDKLDIIEVDS